MGDGEDGGGGARRLLGRQDLHVHTTMSDGDLSLDEVVAAAAALGVKVGIADHVSFRNPRLFVSDRDRLHSYLRALDAAPVLRSGELCWCDAFGAGLPAEVLDRFDYLIGSNHGFALPDGDSVSPWSTTLPPAWADRPDEVMEIMVHNLCDMVAGMPVAIAAHSTLLPAVLLRLEPDVHAWWTAEREDRFIEAAVRNAVAFEISNRYQLPHHRFLVKAREAAARFSLGSDGHQRDQVGRLDWAVAAAEAAGIGDDDLFVVDNR
jgi:histidinol phosphatase-like PHP family hydrolase